MIAKRVPMAKPSHTSQLAFLSAWSTTSSFRDASLATLEDGEVDVSLEPIGA
eukprot:CAMPEP_0172077636 /NCGR_PEP_ID=MMETSP1043-20130122/17171_1 /TAXON_ID=464988 /ORGANISM="Hemiselmis andersenii, Strain CCMP441" /LENGTH=51 /DNA_ID=CAMNT_0012738617 /DNA_START=68 /DNA_END=223 /DNA_ORIENTATION=-